MREIVLYIPVGGHPATADIARGSAIVGTPHAGSDEVEIYFEGADFDQEGMRTLADRAVHAAGRMLEGYPTRSVKVVPREALVAVGTFSPRERRIVLTGPGSERDVAAWLGTLHLDPVELGHRTSTAIARLVPDVSVDVDRALGEVLIERGGVRCDAEAGVWVDRAGRRTAAIAEALMWALVAIAEER